MVFPAHLTSGGKPILADLQADEGAGLHAAERWHGRSDERPDGLDADRARRRVTTRRRRHGPALTARDIEHDLHSALRVRVNV